MIRILTDSAADLSPVEAAMPGVDVVPLRVTFENGETIRDGLDMTGDEFFARLAADEKLPRTSQPAPEDFAGHFRAAKEAGDETIVILISSTLSGTFQCAQLAAEDCGYTGAYFIDSRTASAGEGVLVREALRLRELGIPAGGIAAALEELKERICILAVVDSLKHLHKGGRLPAAVALVGGALGIKPVLAVQDGGIRLADKARGRPGAFVAMFKQIDKMGGIDPDYGYTVLYSDEKSVAGPVHHYVHRNLGMTGGHVTRLGATIGTHIGPNAAGLCFVRSED
ncbi:MAG: DegV family protein [Gemmiger sp.]